VKDHSLAVKDFAAGQLPAGPKGATGPKGDTGPSTGPAGGALTGTYPNPGLAALAVIGSNIADDTIPAGKLTSNSVTGANVSAHSIDMSDIKGTDVTISVSFSLGANSCGTLVLAVSGASPGDVGLIGFTGTVAVPGTVVVLGPVKVTAPGTASVRACNLGASPISASDLGMRVITFG
jgi:hypothetical protein